MNRPEQAIQKAIAPHLDWLAKLIGRFRWFGIFNNVPVVGQHARRIGPILKGMGMKSGVPDILIILDQAKSVFVELKAEGNTPHPAHSRQCLPHLATGNLHPGRGVTLHTHSTPRPVAPVRSQRDNAQGGRAWPAGQSADKPAIMRSPIQGERRTHRRREG